MRSRPSTRTALTGQEFSTGDVVWRAVLLLIPLTMGAGGAWFFPDIWLFGLLLTVVLLTLLVETALGGFRALTAVTNTLLAGFLLGWGSRATWDLRLQGDFFLSLLSSIGPVMAGCYLTLILGLICWRAAWFDPSWDSPEDFLPFVIGSLLIIGLCMGGAQFLTPETTQTSQRSLVLGLVVLLLIFVPTTLYATGKELGHIERHELEGMNREEVWTRALWLVVQPPIAWAKLLFQIPWHLIW